MFKSLKGMFGGKTEEVYTLGAPAKGKAVPLSAVSDPTFSGEILGKGAAVIPEKGEIFSPADGTIGMMFDTKHAVSLTTDYGAEILVHVGLDTVELKGEHYEGHVAAGDQVKKGQLLISFDLEAVKAAGYDVITPVLVCNTPDYKSVEIAAEGQIETGADLIKITK